MSSPTSEPCSPDLGVWDTDGMSYDLLIKNMTLLPPSPPHTSDDESESSPAPSADSPKPEDEKSDDADADKKKPAKKRKSWGQELPTPTTNLPPRKRAKTEAEKEQRRIERVLRNRAAAHSSRERKRAEQEALEKRKKEIEVENREMKIRLAQIEEEFAEFQKKYEQLERNYLLAKAQIPGFVPQALLDDKVIVSDNVAMADVQALSPQSLVQSPPVKAEDDMQTDLLAAAPPASLNTTQHHATVLCLRDLQSVDSLWSDWTLFDDSIVTGVTEPLSFTLPTTMTIDMESSQDKNLDLVVPLTTASSDDLPAPSLSDSTYLDMSFDLFGLGKDEKQTIDLDFLSEPSMALGDLSIPDM
ncbi:hypothetical protein DRE_02988 [Drechslerella stenobrocha 248]|uniref:BZIP domain-containing protein n=1 Tax=Drechslerella stenobrocha 248 TaxID=1043628 RepID=W7I6H0_9PEZI|nr:hypothetical protein DRE_02988 [Drechslerella stenobrocha 248]